MKNQFRRCYLLFLLIAVIILCSCAAVPTTDAGAQAKTVAVDEPELSADISVSDTNMDPTADTAVMDAPISETQPAETVMESPIAVNPAVTEYAFIAVIDEVNPNNHASTFSATVTQETNGFFVGDRLWFSIEDTTKLTDSSGEPLTQDAFTAGSTVGVIFAGLIQESDPAVPLDVTLIALLDN